MDQRILNRRDGITNTRTMVSGTPALTPATRGFRGAADFQEQLIAVRADTSLTSRQRNAKEAELVGRRRRQLGEA